MKKRTTRWNRKTREVIPLRPDSISGDEVKYFAPKFRGQKDKFSRSVMSSNHRLKLASITPFQLKIYCSVSRLIDLEFVPVMLQIPECI